MIRRLKISTLVAICGGCGVALGGMAMLLNKESTRFANQAAFVKTALDMVEKEPEIVEMIGQPYALGKAKVMDLWLRSDMNNVKVRIPVKGSNDTAFIYAFARKKDFKEKLRLFKIEMTFDKIVGKKLILFDNENKGPEDDIAAVDPQDKTPKAQEEKKRSPIPEGMIPEVDPSKPRRVPKSVLRHRKSSETDSNRIESDKSSSSSSSSKQESS